MEVEPLLTLFTLFSLFTLPSFLTLFTLFTLFTVFTVFTLFWGISVKFKFLTPPIVKKKRDAMRNLLYSLYRVAHM